MVMVIRRSCSWKSALPKRRARTKEIGSLLLFRMARHYGKTIEWLLAGNGIAPSSDDR